VANWDPRSGWKLSRRWRGLVAPVLQLREQLRSLGVSVQYELEENCSYATVEATYGAEDGQPADQPLSDQWTLAGNDLEKSLWELPAVRAEFNKIPEDDSKPRALAVIRKNVESLASGELTVVDEFGVEATGTDATSVFLLMIAQLGLDPTVFSKLVSSRAAGVESYTVSQWVLRRTTIIASNSTIKPSLSNIGKLLTTSYLTQIEEIPTTIRFDLPPNGYWLKRTPTFEQTAADKWQITQEWWHADDYDKFIYQLAG
jgi:hypothetical protein